jgi:hypothetical protein
MAKDTKKTDESTDAQKYQDTLLAGQGEEDGTPPVDETTNEGGDGGEETTQTGDETGQSGEGQDVTPGTGEGGDSTTPEPSEFLTSLRAMGYEGDDEEEARQVLLDAFTNTHSDNERLNSRLAELEELAEYGQSYLRDQREQREAELRQQAEAEAAQGQPENWWSPPAFDFAMVDKWRDVTLGEDGTPEIGWKKGTPREVIEGAQAYQEYVDEWATNLVQRPQEILPAIIEQEFNRLFEERISERDQAARTHSFAQQVMDANRDWMYTTDNRGQEVPTQDGQRMFQLLGEAQDRGISDPEHQWDYAVARFDYLNRINQSQYDTASDEAKKTAAQRREEHEKKGTAGKPNRSGTVPRPEETDALDQDDSLSAGEKFLKRLQSSQGGNLEW